MSQTRLSKRARRKLRQEGILDVDNHFNAKFAANLTTIKPKTDNQRLALEYWKADYNLLLHGIAGTGKTFLALYFAAREYFNDRNDYEKIYIVRSTVSSRDQGFLPGSQKQKEAVFESTYHDICSNLFNREDAYPILKQRGVIDFRSTSFLRGSTFENCVIVVDEVQNMSDQELHTIMTRVGENSRIIFAGDVKQDDLTSERKKEMSGLADFIQILRSMREFRHVEFEIDDIVRSRLVRSYIIERSRLGL